MSELTVSQQAAVLAMLLWGRGYRSHFQLIAGQQKELSCNGSADDCLQDYQWLCRIRGDEIPDFRLITHEQRGSPPGGYRLEFNVAYSVGKGFYLHQISAYSTEGLFHQQTLAKSEDLPNINQLLPAHDKNKRHIPPAPKRGRHP